MYQGKKQCYVDPGACADGKKSAQLPGLAWSFAACRAQPRPQKGCADNDAKLGSLVKGASCAKAKARPASPRYCRGRSGVAAHNLGVHTVIVPPPAHPGGMRSIHPHKWMKRAHTLGKPAK